MVLLTSTHSGTHELHTALVQSQPVCSGSWLVVYGRAPRYQSMPGVACWGPAWPAAGGGRHLLYQPGNKFHIQNIRFSKLELSLSFLPQSPQVGGLHSAHTSSCRVTRSSSRWPHLSRCLARLWPVIWNMAVTGRTAWVRKASTYSLAWVLPDK